MSNYSEIDENDATKFFNDEQERLKLFKDNMNLHEPKIKQSLSTHDKEQCTNQERKSEINEKKKLKHLESKAVLELKAVRKLNALRESKAVRESNALKQQLLDELKAVRELNAVRDQLHAYGISI